MLERMAEHDFYTLVVRLNSLDWMLEQVYHMLPLIRKQSNDHGDAVNGSDSGSDSGSDAEPEQSEAEVRMTDAIELAVTNIKNYIGVKVRGVWGSCN